VVSEASLEPQSVSSPAPLRKRLDSLNWRQKMLQQQLAKNAESQQELEDFLELQPRVADRLDELSRQLFGNILEEIELNLTYALREILGQDLRVVSQREMKNRKMHVTFTIERGGKPEDILTGQGGSVCNIISVGLRLIALSQLDEREHRRFLVLDEQDCWLRPDLVPQLMAIIHTIARKLQFQVLVISHHSVDLFREHADRIYRIVPSARDDTGVRIELLQERPKETHAYPDN
jgi:ABC-type glutathione transport system ATPase component